MKLLATLPLPLIRTTLLLSSLLLALTTHALELGEISIKSNLGEPLNAQLPIRKHEDFGPAELLINQAPADIYNQMGVDRSALYQELRFDVNELGLLTISSPQPIKEPYLNFILQFRWADGELYREFNLLLDPPAP
ncbi:FimV family protein [Oceanicoccus sp. KOV_DT_Chl]|uniref:type IV pilus assembly protein FimV n=1 Tax=Oceanicoccus sp. KOV_DT_Chl TaxID=1904639 RepID=UPI000C798656|nr:hypothetical protein [Oceanicoccus sp. KOV_DT_Chl]